MQDDLKLVVHLHAIWIFRVATVVGAKGWLNIGYVPRLWSEYSQTGRWISGAGPNLLVIGEPDKTALALPILLQRRDDFLE